MVGGRLKRSGVWLLIVGVLALAGGVLCFAADKPNIIVENNVIAQNGLGIYLGWYGDWYISVIGNRIEGNGEGIRLVNRRAFIQGNFIADNTIGVRVTSEHEERSVTTVEQVILRGNEFVGNELYAIQNLTSTVVNASDNWWGSTGPQLVTSARWGLGMLILSLSSPPPAITLELGINSPVPRARFFSDECGLSLDLGLGKDAVAERNTFFAAWDIWGYSIVVFPWIITPADNLIVGPVEIDGILERGSKGD